MQISNDWFVAETEFENKSFIIRGRLFLDAIRQSGKFATRIALVWEYQGDEKGMPTEKETQALDSLNEKLRDILEEKEIAVSPIPEEFLWNETVHVHSETDNPDRLYTTLLLDALNGTVLSYCSCVNDFKALKNSRFSHVVTNKNNRFRLEKEQEERLERERQEQLQ